MLEAGVDDLGGVEEAEACGVHGGAADSLSVDEALVGAEGLHRLAHDIVVLGFLSAGAAGADLVLQGDKLLGCVGFIASLYTDACGECAEGAGYGGAGGVKLGALRWLLACLAVLLGGDEGVDLGVDEFIQANVGGLDGNIRSHAYGCSRAEGSADKLGGFGSALLGADEVGGVSQARDRDRSRGEDRDELAGGVVAGGKLVRGVEAIEQITFLGRGFEGFVVGVACSDGGGCASGNTGNHCTGAGWDGDGSGGRACDDGGSRLHGSFQEAGGGGFGFGECTGAALEVAACSGGFLDAGDVGVGCLVVLVHRAFEERGVVG